MKQAGDQGSGGSRSSFAHFLTKSWQAILENLAGTEPQQIAKKHILEELDGEAAEMAFALQRDKALERIIAKGPGAEWRESGNVAQPHGQHGSLS